MKLAALLATLAWVSIIALSCCELRRGEQYTNRNLYNEICVKEEQCK